MAKYYSVVSVESETLQSVSTVLDELFGGDFNVETSRAYLGIFFDLEDRSEEYEYAKNYLLKENLDDDFQYPDNIDMSKFGVELDLYTTADSVGYKFIDVLADSVAQKLSSYFKNRVILRIGELDSPLFIYQNGIRVYEFIKENEIFLKDKSWHPS